MRFRMAATFRAISVAFRSCAAVFPPMAKQYTVVPLKPEVWLLPQERCGMLPVGSLMMLV
jgi:hypothetical protein